MRRLYTLAPEDTHKEGSSLPYKNDSSQHKDMEFAQKENILVDEVPVPQINNGVLPDLVQEIRTQKRSSPGKMEEAILILCKNRYVMCQELADVLNRNMETLKNHYLSKMVIQGRLVLRFPGQPTHPAQAYQAAVTADKGENHEG